MQPTFQSPPGTRDFFPADMALRRYIEDTWRKVSLRHGFLEVDGPTFEFLDLYKVKSGDEIVSQLFHFESRGEDKKEFALRPEFTPTLARMVAARANSLPRPIKWFSIPRCYRAERPQKGRLREFIQWNVDMFGGDTPEAKRQFDLETVALALDCLQEFGLSSTDITLLWNDRTLVEHLFEIAGVRQEKFAFAFYLLDRIAKLSPDQRNKLYIENAVGDSEKAFFENLAAGKDPLHQSFWEGLSSDVQTAWKAYAEKIVMTNAEINHTLKLMGFDYPEDPNAPRWAKYDPSIVRGLAYYTGFVWEISDTRGQNRAVAGGGRYDKLIEMFGGPSLPATGFGMGDVVLQNLLEELKKLPANSAPAPDIFLINALATTDEATKLLAQLRNAKLAAITSYKATKNIGKLLQDASASGAKLALILAPQEFDRGVLKLKNLATREEKEIALIDVVTQVQATITS
jgi:histidyl-tRNA synthetase